MATEHRVIPDAERHEVKGASTATNNQVLVSDGDGTTSFRQPTMMGWYNYDHDGATVPLTLAATFYDLINDAAGPSNDITFAISGATTIWDTGTNRFDFTDLIIGDVVELRVDVSVTTGTANTAIDLVLELAEGTGSEVTLPLTIHRDIKTAGTYQVVLSIPFPISTTSIKNNPARLMASADKTGATVIINGWFVNVIRPGAYT